MNNYPVSAGVLRRVNAVKPLTQRLRDASTVKSWNDADVQRLEAACMLERMHQLLTQAYAYIEDWSSDSQEAMLARRAIMENIAAICDEVI